ncbi:MAG: hypothetical protein HUU50_19415 [Candidatus Brocadiae bacterium]|nr:hypothetical protein [Candidatus Brocadiia bacterium]
MFFTIDTRKGSALIIAMIMSIVIISLSSSAILMAVTEQRYTYNQSNKLKSRYAAEAGLAEGVKFIKDQCLLANLNYLQIDLVLDPSRVISPEERAEKVITIYNEDYIKVFYQKNLEAAVTVGEFQSLYNLGQYSAGTRILGPDDISTGKDMTGNNINSVRYVLLTSVGQFPKSGVDQKSTTFKVVYEVSTDVSKIFDYSYFINNWGWWFGDSIHCKGNARSNGSFSMSDDTKDYRPILQGRPRFENSIGIDLIGYIDDNLDGKADGQDGGMYAWNEILGRPKDGYKPANLYAGLMGQNQSPPVPQVPMPNLNNISYYESIAREKNGSIEILDLAAGTSQVIFNDGVWGDNEPNGKKHLYLEGSAQKPIKVNGVVVIQGDLVIRGYITGRGSIYCARNAYLPQRLLYKNPPVNTKGTLSQYREAKSGKETDREEWRSANVGKDLVGLFAKENIVLGDFTNDEWQNEVNKSLVDSRNKNEEDLGLDQIPGTGDVGEDNTTWDVERDAAGNVIPGSGEDYDGDGIQDRRTLQEDFYLQTGSFYYGHPDWGGNIPSKADSYRSVTYWDNNTMGTSSDRPMTLSVAQNPNPHVKYSLFPQVDAILYTNHFLAGYVQNQYLNEYFGLVNGENYTVDNTKKTTSLYSGQIVFNGSIISRNDGIYYTANKLLFNHDDRLTAETGETLGMVIPRVWKELQPISMTVE